MGVRCIVKHLVVAVVGSGLRAFQPPTSGGSFRFPAEQSVTAGRDLVFSFDKRGFYWPRFVSVPEDGIDRWQGGKSALPSVKPVFVVSFYLIFLYMFLNMKSRLTCNVVFKRSSLSKKSTYILVFKVLIPPGGKVDAVGCGSKHR